MNRPYLGRLHPVALAPLLLLNGPGVPMLAKETRLRYLNSRQVETPVGQLCSMVLRSPTDEKVGTVDGVLIDPLERRVSYYVVESRTWWASRRYLVPAEPMRLEPARMAMRVDFEPQELGRCETFHADGFPPFSDDDLVTALFSSRAA